MIKEAATALARLEEENFWISITHQKLEFLRTDPGARQMDAVKNDRIVILDAHSMDPSIRNVAALETVAAEERALGHLVQAESLDQGEEAF